MWYLIAGLFAAIWVGLDARSRRSAVVFHAVGAFLLAPIVVPLWISSRPLHRGETREGGKGWNVLKNFALSWTLTMIIATVVALVRIGGVADKAHSDAEKTGTVIGAALGLGVMGAIWFFPMVGALLLGFFLRKLSENEVGPTGPLANPNLPVRSGWTTATTTGLAILAVLLCIAVPPILTDALGGGVKVATGRSQAASAVQASSTPAESGAGCEGVCSGSSSPELDQALQARAEQSVRCYNQALSQDSTLKGHVSINVRIGPSGNICSVTVASNDMGSPTVANCAANVFRTGSGYPSPRGGCIDANVPLSFMPAPQNPIVSMASFTKNGNVLNKCVDVELTPESHEERQDVIKQFSEFVVVPKTCDEAFAERTVFASCSTSSEASTAVAFKKATPQERADLVKASWRGPSITEHYYNVESLERDDHYMRNCMDGGGQWWAMPRNDPEYLHARIQQQVRNIQRAAEQMQGAAQ